MRGGASIVSRILRSLDPLDGPDIPWHTEQHVAEAAARMKAWAQGQADILADARWCDLTDEEWRSLARVALEVRDDAQR
jgi:hypothetical protein